MEQNPKTIKRFATYILNKIKTIVSAIYFKSY